MATSLLRDSQNIAAAAADHVLMQVRTQVRLIPPRGFNEQVRLIPPRGFNELILPETAAAAAAVAAAAAEASNIAAAAAAVAA